MLYILKPGSSCWKNVSLPSPAAGAHGEGAGSRGNRASLGSERRGGCWQALEAPYSLDRDAAQPPSGRKKCPVGLSQQKMASDSGSAAPTLLGRLWFPSPKPANPRLAASRVTGGLQGASLRARRRFPTASSPASHAGGGALPSAALPQ